MTAAAAMPVASVAWSPGFRITPTRYPSISLFDRVAAPEDFGALYELESMTNDRLRDEVGDIALVATDERVYGPGTTPIMAAFTHLNPEGSRFSDGSYGVFYAAQTRETAIVETKYHQGRFLAATRQGPTRVQMRLYSVLIKAELHDLRASADAELYSATSYSHAQIVAKSLRAQGAAGVIYRSVRHAGGECVGLFKPRGASACNHASYLEYEWNGRSFTGILERLE